MNNRNEENFKNALKTLVMAEPEKLAYFGGREANVQAPPFVPEFRTGGQAPPVVPEFRQGGQAPPVVPEFRQGGQAPPVAFDRRQGVQAPPYSPERKRVSNAGKRRQYTYSMAAAAACFVVFVLVAAYGFAPDMFGRGVAGPGGSGGTEGAVQAPGFVSQEGDDTGALKEAVPPDPDDGDGPVTLAPDPDEGDGPVTLAPDPDDGDGPVTLAPEDDDFIGKGTDPETTDGGEADSAGGQAAAGYELEESRAVPYVPLAIAAAAASLFVVFFVKRRRLGL